MEERPATDGTGNQNFRPQTRKKHNTQKLDKEGRKKKKKQKTTIQEKLTMDMEEEPHNVILYPDGNWREILGWGIKTRKICNITKYK